MWRVMSEKFGCAVRETGVQLTSSIHLPDIALFCYINSLSTQSECWNTGLPWLFPGALGKQASPVQARVPPSSSEITGLFLPAFLMCSCFLWHGQRRASELDHLMEESWWSSAVHCGWMILRVSHVSEMLRESKCISHLQINQICHMSAYLNTS